MVSTMSKPRLPRVEERWRRLDRWYRRFRHYQKPTSYPGRGPHDDPDLLTVEDYALAFLLECLSIRDWFKKAPDVFKQQDVETLFKDPDLMLCRDIANRLKHMDIDKPGVDATVEVDRGHVPGGSGLVVLADGKRYDLVALCQRCYDSITKFLEANGWSLPLMRLVPELGDFVV
jgi:hypothetical protein